MITAPVVAFCSRSYGQLYMAWFPRYLVASRTGEAVKPLCLEELSSSDEFRDTEI